MGTPFLCGLVALLMHCAVNATNPCAHKQTCHECLQVNSCAWCSRPTSNTRDFDEINRCFQAAEGSSNCEGYIVDLKNHGVITEENNLTRKSVSHHEVVQISPQKVSLRLRVNTPYKLTIHYSEAEDFPVDLYYLMDVSRSMEDDILNLRRLALNLARAMKGITSNFRLGFGSFVDKSIQPFITSESNRKLIYGSRPAYGFRNHLKLTNDTSEFLKTVNHVNYANAFESNDEPEGGLDAIMQAVVCKEAIGWRDGARRIILFSTDYEFHMAGDGKLAGLVFPNDGLCHLDRNNEYDYSNKQDYPSISQINRKVKDHGINIIFAVTSWWRFLYDQLSAEIEGSTVATVSSDSSNIVDLVKKEYNKIRSSVAMKAESKGPVTVSFSSRCLDDGPEVQRSRCDGLVVGSVVSFTAELFLNSCPLDPAGRHTSVRIYPVSGQALTVSLDMLCDCPCEAPGHQEYEERSTRCSSHGNYKCGMCDCDPSYVGRACECGKDSPEGVNATRSCQKEGSLEVCSGRGECRCGQCVCEKIGPNKKIFGPHCECDNFSCKRGINQKMCGGEEHGTCVCDGKCNCAPGWTGEDCLCSLSTKACQPPRGGDICSGRGSCVCGQCKCDVASRGRRYLGNFCQICPTCPEKCEELKHCVECLTYKTGPLRDSCSNNCSHLHHDILDEIKVPENSGEVFCDFPLDKDNCYLQFIYSYNSDLEIFTKAPNKKQCHIPIDMFEVGIFVAGSILLVGLATLILWKIITTAYDQREYARFQKEIANVKWSKGDNPLYMTAVTSFANPTFSVPSSASRAD